MPLLSSNNVYQEPITGDAFTLTYRFCINSDCPGAQSLLSKDIGEETVTFELLPFDGASCCIQSHGQVFTDFNAISSEESAI